MAWIEVAGPPESTEGEPGPDPKDANAENDEALQVAIGVVGGPNVEPNGEAGGEAAL